MKIRFRFILLLPLLVFLAAVCGCTQDRMGMLVPDPNSKPSTGEIPSGDPFNPEDPGQDPDTPDILDDNPWDSPERQARIGITPIIEIYYTEYTKDDWFPSLEEVRNFTHINVGHVRFKDKVNGTGIEIPAKSISIVEKFVAYKAQYPEIGRASCRERV